MSISEEVYEHLNASKHAVKVPQSLGGGRMAIFEMIHQVHCVVSVSKALCVCSTSDLSKANTVAGGVPRVLH